MDFVNLNSFLKLGYFIKYHNEAFLLAFSHIDKLKYRDHTEDELVEIGTTKFIDAIANDFKTDQQHVIPLSGGLDSRAILAALLKFTPTSNIKTYTFGTPGTLDYEIGNFIAHVTGTEQVAFPLSEYVASQEEYLDVSKRVDHQTVLFHHPPIWELDKLYKGCQFWSGYIGDAITGGHVPCITVDNPDNAKIKYLQEFQFVTSIDLSQCSLDDLFEHIHSNFFDKRLLSYEEQLLYMERVQKITAPHILMEGFNYKTPFINNDFMDFMLSIDDSYRRNQYLYKKILLNLSPELFSLKTKNNYGLPLDVGGVRNFVYRAYNKGKNIISRVIPKFVRPGLNYMDFEKVIRENVSFKEIIRSNVYDLQARHLVDWVDIDQIWNNHMRKKNDHADALMTLASLELHLKSQNI